MSARWVVRTALAILVRPTLWPTAIVQMRRLAPRQWWRHRPFLPIPRPDYLRFRLQTMYGDAARAPDPADVIAYVRWCREFPTGVSDHRPHPGK